MRRLWSDLGPIKTKGTNLPSAAEDRCLFWVVGGTLPHCRQSGPRRWEGCKPEGNQTWLFEKATTTQCFGCWARLDEIIWSDCCFKWQKVTATQWPMDMEWLKTENTRPRVNCAIVWLANGQTGLVCLKNTWSLEETNFNTSRARKIPNNCLITNIFKVQIVFNWINSSNFKRISPTTFPF